MPLRNFAFVSELVTRSAQPDVHGFRVLRELDVRLVFKLNTDDEFSVALERQLLNGATLAAVPGLDVFWPDRGIVEAIVDEIQIATRAGDAVHLHCEHGRDRTGLIAGAFQILVLGWSAERALAEFDAFGPPMITRSVDWRIRALLKTLASPPGGKPVISEWTQRNPPTPTGTP